MLQALGNINTQSSKRYWKNDLTINISGKQWKLIILQSKNMSSISQENKFKVIQKLQTTPYQRSRYNKSCSALCKQWKQQAGGVWTVNLL